MFASSQADTAYPPDKFPRKDKWKWTTAFEGANQLEPDLLFRNRKGIRTRPFQQAPISFSFPKSSATCWTSTFTTWKAWEKILWDDTPEIRRSTQFGTCYLRLARALELRFVVTVEPGLYFIPQLPA